MGTRGLYGFRKNGVDKTTYNHYDSYPDGLGNNVLLFVNSHNLKELNDIYDKIILVDETSTPTVEQIKECMDYLDLDVSNQSVEDWYCLLRKAQGDLEHYSGNLKYMIDNHDFILDSLFCEYAYIINLDTNKLEFWRGFQMSEDSNSRYHADVSEDSNSGYFACRLIKEYDLGYIMDCNSADIDNFVKDMNQLLED